MRNFIAYLILIFLLPNIAEAKDYPPRTVEMELEEVENATAYELEFNSKSSGKTVKFKTKSNQWKAKIKPGQYSFRLRSYDERSVAGEWSEFFPISIAFPGPKMLYPLANQKLPTDEETQESVNLKWENIEGVPLYRVEVTHAENNWTEITEQNEHELKLPVGATYSWNVFAMLSKGDQGTGSGEAQTFTLLGSKLDEPEIIQPVDHYINEIGWTAPKRAETYTYILSKKALNGSWSRVSRGKGQAKRMIAVPEDIPGGTFKLQVRADAANVLSSDIKELEFELALGSRDPASVNKSRLKESIEKPTDWYFIASYLVANADYRGVDNEQTTNTKFNKAFAGTGRLGLGYHKPKATWGGFGFIDYGGFKLNGEIETFMAVEAHATWRKYFGPNQLRVSGGLFLKEIMEGFPEVIGDPKLNFRTVTYLGPHFGFEYWKPISPKLGWQLNSRLYFSMAGDTPNGNDIVFTPSYQVGAMGSYKLSKNIMGFAGLAYRKDSVKYESEACTGVCSGPTAAEGDRQEVNLSGVYLNLLLEWAF